MMMMSMMCLITSMFMTLPKINNPMMMTLMMILIALTTALIFCMEVSSWYAFLLFLIYVGGMLVMFAYFTATSPNQYSNKNKSIFMMTPILFIGLMLIMLMMNKSTLTIDSQSNQLMMMFTTPNIYTLIMITLVLLITMVIVVKLSSSSKGPLRAFMT